MRTQIILIAALAALLQVEAHPALFGKPSGGIFGGILGKKEVDVDLALADADEINDAAAEAAAEAKETSSFFQNAIGAIKDKTGELAGAVSDSVSNIQEGAMSAIEQGQERVTARVEQAQETASTIAEKVQGVQTGVQEQVSAAIEKAQEIQSGVQEQIAGTVNGAIETAQSVGGKIAGAIDTVAPVTLWGRIVGFFTGFLRPSAKDINNAINENIESAAASLTSIGSGLPTMESAGLLKPPTPAALA